MSKKVGWPKVKRAPVDSQAQVALALCSKAADGRSVKGEVVIALDDELLVVVQHVQSAFEVAEQYGDGLNAFLVSQILQPLFLNLVRRNALHALFLGFKVQFFQFWIRQRQEITKFS